MPHTRSGLRSTCVAAALALSAAALSAQSTYLDALVYGPKENPIGAAAFLLAAQGQVYNDILVSSATITTGAGFVPALEAEFPPNLVILDLSAGPPDGDWPGALAAYLASGGCAIATVQGAADASAIAALFDATFGAEHDALGIQRWVTDPLWQSYVEIPSSLPTVDNNFEPNGVYLDAAAGGVAHGGFTADPTPGQAAIVVGNQGRTILHGFLPADLSPNDQEADGDDMLELGENEVFAVGATGCGAIPPSVLEVPALSGTGLTAMALFLALAATAALLRRRRAGERLDG